MPQNKLQDLRNHLFLTLERLNDPEYDGEKKEMLDSEVNRAVAVAKVSSVIVNSAKIETQFLKLSGKYSQSSGFIALNTNQKQSIDEDEDEE